MTTQFVTGFRLHPARLVALNSNTWCAACRAPGAASWPLPTPSSLARSPTAPAAPWCAPRLRGLKVGGFEYCAEPLQLGHLAGNCFTLLMRGIAPLAGGEQSEQALEQQVKAAQGGAEGVDMARHGRGTVCHAGCWRSPRALPLALASCSALPPCARLQVHASCSSVAARGFVNYFGLQRFGTSGTPTHK